MKHYLLFILFLVSFSFSSCQKTPDEIAAKVIEKAESVEAISWTEYVKHTAPFLPDTTIHRKSQMVFKKDTSLQYYQGLFSMQLYKSSGYPISEEQKPIKKAVYDGKFEASIDYENKEALITDFEKYEELNEQHLNAPFFVEIASILNYTLSNDSVPVVLAGEEIIGGEPCYKLEINFRDMNVQYVFDSLYVEKMEGQNQVKDYTVWVSKKDFVPRRFIYDSYKKDTKDLLRAYYDHEFSQIKSLAQDTLIFKALAAVPEGFDTNENIPRSYKPWLGLPLNEKAPVWVLPSLKGSEVSLEQHKDNLLLIEFTSISCGPCHRVMPKIKNLYNKYNAKGLNVVAIEIWNDNKEVLEKVIGPNELPYPYLYKAKDVAKNYKVKAVPSFYLIDQKGKVVYRSLGDDSDFEETMSAEIEKYF